MVSNGGELLNQFTLPTKRTHFPHMGQQKTLCGTCIFIRNVRDIYVAPQADVSRISYCLPTFGAPLSQLHISCISLCQK